VNGAGDAGAIKGRNKATFEDSTCQACERGGEKC